MSVIAPIVRRFSSEDACELTGVSYRQLDHWSRVGYLGEQLVGRGSGSQRRFGAHDLEVVDAIRQLSDLGCLRMGPVTHTARLREQAFHEALRIARDRPVAAGEWLIVTLDPPTARRMVSPSLAGQRGPLWAVPLRTAEELTS